MMPRWSLCLAVLLQPWCASASAATQGSASRVEIPFEKYTLSNGLEVILHRDGSVPLVAVDLWYHVGGGDEVPGKSGFAHLFEHMMFEGTAHTGPNAHLAILQAIGSTDANGATNESRTEYFETVPANQLETALWLESERMGFLLPGIDEKALANQREVVRNERRESADNAAYGRERMAVAAALYPEGHPYRYTTIGRHEDIESGSLDDVRAFFATWYVPANATLTLAGDFTIADAKRLVEKWFGSFPASRRPTRRAPGPGGAPSRRLEVHDSFAKLRRVHFAWPSPAIFAPGDAELDLLARVLGAEGTGRLYRRLVLEHPWAQQVSVRQASQSGVSVFHVVADLLPDADLAAVENAIVEEVADVAKRPVTEAELRRARVSFEDGFVRGLESVMSRAQFLSVYNHFLGDPGRVQWDLDRYVNATREGVLAAAARALVPSARVEVVTLPVAAPQEDPPIASAGTATLRREMPRPQALVFPEAPSRLHQPAAGPEPVLAVPPVVRFESPQGIDVVLLERHQIPAVRFEIEFPNGTPNDPVGKSGLAPMCMDLLDEGTAALSPEAFQQALADLGATVRASDLSDRQSLVADALTRRLDETLALWSAVLRTPGLRADDFERVRARRLAALAQERGNALSLGTRLARAVLYGRDHPFGRLPTAATLQAVTLDDCRTLAATWLRPRGARLYVVGDVTRSAVEAALAKYLTGWTGAPAVRAELPLPVALPGRIFFSDLPGAAQSRIVIGEPGPPRTAPDYVPTRVALRVLGGDDSSRLNMNLRENKGWAYGAGSYATYFPNTSILRSIASVRTDATADAVRELFLEARRLAASGITPAELERTTVGEARSLPERFATGDAALASMRELVTFDLPFDTWSRYGAALRAVTTAQADAAAAAHVHPDALRIIVVGDGAKVLPGLKALLAPGGALVGGDLVRLDADGAELPD
jgi:zinc protease